MFQSVDLARALRQLPLAHRPRGAGVRHRGEAIELIQREALANPVFAYRIFPVHAVRGDVIDLGYAVIEAPTLVAGDDIPTAVAAAACTLGPQVQARISALFATRRRSLALALDTAANELLFRLADRASAAIRRDARRQNLYAGNEASPGDPGVPLGLQSVALALAEAARIGIYMDGAGMLAPIKSLSFLVAMGPNRIGRSSPGRCDCCPSRERCAKT